MTKSTINDELQQELKKIHGQLDVIQQELTATPCRLSAFQHRVAVIDLKSLTRRKQRIETFLEALSKMDEDEADKSYTEFKKYKK